MQLYNISHCLKEAYPCPLTRSSVQYPLPFFCVPSLCMTMVSPLGYCFYSTCSVYHQHSASTQQTPSLLTVDLFYNWDDFCGLLIEPTRICFFSESISASRVLCNERIILFKMGYPVLRILGKILECKQNLAIFKCNPWKIIKT